MVTVHHGVVPCEVSPERFDELVAEALDAIPEELGRLMENVVVLTADRPTRGQQRGFGTLLGLYEGVALTRRGPVSYKGVLPDRITIFRLAHCRRARDEDELRRNVTRTVAHEVGHHFGISDRRLRELGY